MPRSKAKATGANLDLPLGAASTSLAKAGRIELLTLSVSSTTYAAIKAAAKRSGRSMAEEARAWLDERARKME
jgi:hypothetical protein